jgi:hypothetical protein
MESETDFPRLIGPLLFTFLASAFFAAFFSTARHDNLPF